MLDLDEVKLILLVEDNPHDEELTLLALKKYHIRNEVVVVRDGAEALDFLFARGKFAGRDPSLEPQLVLLDLRLPKIDGFEVLRRVRSDPTTKHIPVVVLTSSHEERDAIESYNLGANGFARKPLDMAELMEAVRRVGGGWVVISERPAQPARMR